MRFRDRKEAGRHLAAQLVEYANQPDVIVLALPRGGVPVAYEIAEAIGAPLDVFLVRKLGVPGHEELAMGAIATGGARVLNEDVIRYLDIPDETIEAVTEREGRELERRERLYRDERPARDIFGRVVILVDDGLATGSTMRAAAAAVRERQPARVVIAVPVAAREACESLNDAANGIFCVCTMTPDPFYALSLWYEDFTQTTDEEVRELLDQSERRVASLVNNRQDARIAKNM